MVKEVVEVNEEKTRHMFMFCHLTAGHSHNIKTANKSLENVAGFRCLGIKQIRIAFKKAGRGD
jgi:hypothetical protein